MILSLEVREPDLDAGQLDTLTRLLRQELLLLDVDKVTVDGARQTPPGARGDPTAIGSLVMTLANSAVLVGVCQVLRAWQARQQGRSFIMKLKDGRPVSLEIHGDNAAQHQQLIDDFLAAIDPDRP